MTTNAKAGLKQNVTIEAYYAELEDNHTAETVENIKNFISWQRDHREGNPLLTSAVIKCIGATEFLSQVEVIAKNGVDSSVINNADAKTFYIKHKKLIIEWARNLGSLLGSREAYLTAVSIFLAVRNYDLYESEICMYLNSDDTESEKFLTFSSSMTGIVFDDVCADYCEWLLEKMERREAKLEYEFS